MNKLVFSDEATFHLSGRMNRHNLWIWGSENPYESFEHERDSSKVTVFAAVTRKPVRAILLYRINSDTDHPPGHVTWMVSAAAAGRTFQTWFINKTVTHRTSVTKRGLTSMNVFVIVGLGVEAVRNGLRDRLTWHRVIYFCGVLWRTSTSPPLPTTLHELKIRISEACANTDQEILHNVWLNIGGRISVWCCSSHSWRSCWTLLMTNYCSFSW
jgi:hypothetical protein